MEKFLYNNGVSVENITPNIKREGSSIAVELSSTKKLYIGSVLPFNSRFFKFTNLNVIDNNLTVKYWNGTEYENMVDVEDETDGMKQDGYIVWTPNKDVKWQKADTSEISEFAPIVMYDKYWVEISSDTDISFTIDWIDHLFGNDEDLRVEYPGLLRTDLMDAWESGKVNWQRQFLRASELIVEAVESQRIAFKDQILDYRDFKTICVSLVASIAYTPMGDTYEKDAMNAYNTYQQRFRDAVITKDTSGNAIGDKGTKDARVIWGRR